MTTLGGFEPWSDTLAEVLGKAGVEGFLENQDAFFEKSDEDAGEWEAFLVAWAAYYGDKPIPVTDLATDIFDGKGALREALPSPLAAALDRSREKPAQGFKVSIGKALAKKEGTRYGADELYLEIASRDTRGGSPRWRVCSGVQGLQGSIGSLTHGNPDDDIPF